MGNGLNSTQTSTTVVRFDNNENKASDTFSEHKTDGKAIG